MRLLVLTHRLPVPPRKGEKIRALNVIKHLSARHEIYLGTLVDDVADLAHLGDLRPWVKCCRYRRLMPRVKKSLALASVLRGRSASVDYFYSDALQSDVDMFLEHEGVEGVVCSSSPMAEYLFRSKHITRVKEITKIMDLIDVDSVKWADYAAKSTWWRALLYRREAQVLGAYERRIAESFDQVLLVSDAERRSFPQSPVPPNVRVMANGVDLEFFSPTFRSSQAIDRPSLVFTGVMDYKPNVDGVTWFVERVFPQILRVEPNVRFYVVGNRPTASVRRLAKQSGVTVTGLVDDVREYIGAADICIAPLRIARGIQNKVLEAMAMGKPVVATRVAFEGIDARPGRDLLVTDDEASFAAATIALLKDPMRRALIGTHARRCAESRYAWDRHLNILDHCLDRHAISDPVESARPKVG